MNYESNRRVLSLLFTFSPTHATAWHQNLSRDQTDSIIVTLQHSIPISFIFSCPMSEIIFNQKHQTEQKLYQPTKNTDTNEIKNCTGSCHLSVKTCSVVFFFEIESSCELLILIILRLENFGESSSASP